MIPCIEVNISDLSRESLIKVLLVLELEKWNLGREDKDKQSFSDRELRILALLYNRGGVSNSSDMDNFVQECLNLKLTRTDSAQSIRNVLTKARNLRFVRRKTVNNWKVDIIPNIHDSDNLVVKCLLTDYAINQ